MARQGPPYFSPQANTPPMEGFGGPPPPPTVVVTEDPKVVRATRMHRQGSLLFLVAWLAIATAIVMLAGDMALIISMVLNSSASNEPLAVDLTIGSLSLLGGGVAVRGVAFTLMLHADFLLKSRIPPRFGLIQ